MVDLKPIGYLRSSHSQVPNHWSISELEGELVIEPEYTEGVSSIEPGDEIAVIFQFHRSPPFSSDKLRQKPPNRSSKRGVFSICSPRRPNPIGLSILEVVSVDENVIRVSGIDMLDGTPILDIKPHITG